MKNTNKGVPSEMKRKFFSIFIALTLLIAVFGTASAQLGQTDVSSFTIQNVDDTPATVGITFIDENGVETVPSELNAGQTNPFTLDPGESFEIYMPGIPEAQLPSGRYSVAISSTAEVVAIANLIGEGSVFFNGSYSGFESGATLFYLPAVVYNYFGWYSMISVQNVDQNPADVTVTITCEDGSQGTLTANDVPSMASHHFVLKETKPTGFPDGKSCNGSAVVSSDFDIVAVDNQSVPANGNTQSYGGVTGGNPSLYVPALYNAYFGWNASLNVQKVESGSTTVNVDFSDGGSASCNLTDAKPSCLFYMPGVHPGTGYFGATVTNTANKALIGVVNAANGDQAQTYNAVSAGTKVVGIPSVMKSYFGWNTSFTCQNLGSNGTTLEVEYEGHAGNVYNTPTVAVNDTIEIFQPAEAFLPNGYQGSVTITGNATNAQISCIVNFNNGGQMNSTSGDWSMSYNAFNK